MNYNAVMAIQFVGVEGKTRTHFAPSEHGLIGGIQFRLKTWKAGEYVTCFLVPPSKDVTFHAGQDSVMPAKITIPPDLADTFQAGSEFELFEIAPIAKGKLLSVFPNIK